MNRKRCSGSSRVSAHRGSRATAASAPAPSETRGESPSSPRRRRRKAAAASTPLAQRRSPLTSALPDQQRAHAAASVRRRPRSVHAPSAARVRSAASAPGVPPPRRDTRRDAPRRSPAAISRNPRRSPARREQEIGSSPSGFQAGARRRRRALRLGGSQLADMAEPGGCGRRARLRRRNRMRQGLSAPRHRRGDVRQQALADPPGTRQRIRIHRE